ncbi:MAG: hypothetical protein M0C28_33485 [Candidatus Moduliflexus flocculans]|nr:hypothetical protein [Candidatus Moduliflexus flocculans]
MQKAIDWKGDTRSIIGNSWRCCARRLFSTTWPSYLARRRKPELLEIAYARAVGRGKNAEADAAWGEEHCQPGACRKDGSLMQEPDVPTDLRGPLTAGVSAGLAPAAPRGI